MPGNFPVLETDHPALVRYTVMQFVYNKLCRDAIFPLALASNSPSSPPYTLTIPFFASDPLLSSFLFDGISPSIQIYGLSSNVDSSSSVWYKTLTATHQFWDTVG